MELLQGKLDSVEHGLAKCIVLIKHRDPANSAHLPELIYLFPGLIVIGGPYVDHVVLEWFVKHFSSGEEANHRDSFRLSERNVFGGSGRADKEAESENILLDHPSKARGSLVGVVAIVKR
jgi:hypothetical protein